MELTRGRAPWVRVTGPRPMGGEEAGAGRAGRARYPRAADDAAVKAGHGDAAATAAAPSSWRSSRRGPRPAERTTRMRAPGLLRCASFRIAGFLLRARAAPGPPAAGRAASGPAPGLWAARPADAVTHACRAVTGRRIRSESAPSDQAQGTASRLGGGPALASLNRACGAAGPPTRIPGPPTRIPGPPTWTRIP